MLSKTARTSSPLPRSSETSSDSHIAMTVALVIVDAVFVALLVASWFYMPGGLFLLVILGYGTMLMLHIPVTERVFNPYLID